MGEEDTEVEEETEGVEETEKEEETEGEGEEETERERERRIQGGGRAAGEAGRYLVSTALQLLRVSAAPRCPLQQMKPEPKTISAGPIAGRSVSHNTFKPTITLQWPRVRLWPPNGMS